MIRWVGLHTMLVYGLAGPALADPTPGVVSSDALLYVAQKAILLCGLAFTGYWAYQAFNAPPIPLGEGPALPRYMTQPRQYRLGAIVYVGLCLVVYGLLAYFHRALFPLAGIVDSDLGKAIDTATTDGSLAYPLVVVFAAAIFVASLKFERDWNPLLVLRGAVHGWIAIPRLANAIMVMARDELVVPAESRAAIVADAGALLVADGDFDKDRLSLDRSWAELCYIRSWLEGFRAQGSHLTFFGEPSFAWDKLQADFESLRLWVAPLKRGEVHDAANFADIVGKVDALRRHYCRLAACFLVFKNQTESGALSDARAFGVTLATERKRANPLRYVAIFFVAIMAAIYLGVTLSAMTWDLMHHGVGAALSQDPDLITRWMGYALSNYGTAITAVLVLRYLGWTVDKSQPDSYLVSYAAVFLVALAVATLCLSLAIQLAAAGPTSSLPYPTIVYTTIKWSVSPAIVAVYIAYHMDRQIDPLLPDLGSERHWELPQRLISCFFFGVLVSVFAALPATTARASGSWEASKVQMVIIGTTFFVGLVMAVVGEFFLVKPSPEKPDLAVSSLRGRKAA